MPFCTHCGTEVARKFCSHCGELHPEEDFESVRVATKEMKERFIVDYEGFDQRVRAAFSDARFVFLEAVGACADGYLSASAVMSRAALEATLYSARIQEKTIEGNPLIQGSVMRILPETQFQWWKLRNWAKKNGLLDKKLAIKCDKVRTIGNFAAHYAEQLGRNRATSVSRAEPEETAANITPINDPIYRNARAKKLLAASYQILIPAEDTYWSLNITRQVILKVAEQWGRPTELS